jgi:hypothetical protein
MVAFDFFTLAPLKMIIYLVAIVLDRSMIGVFYQSVITFPAISLDM